MKDIEAIREFKKISRIVTKIHKNGYDVSIIEGTLVLATNEQSIERSERFDNMDGEGKEFGLNEGEILHTIDF